MSTTFDKRIFSPASFQQAIAELFEHLPDLKTAVRGGRISKAFSERIMLAVTQVNGCRYCHYGHARMALKAGVTEDEIQALVAGDFDDLPPHEVPALLFAQHYAETQGHPDPEAWQALINTYGEASAQDIMAYIRMITLGNLYGNTFDALLSRLRGRPAAGSSILKEMGVLLGGFVIIPAEWVRHRRR